MRRALTALGLLTLALAAGFAQSPGPVIRERPVPRKTRPTPLPPNSGAPREGSASERGLPSDPVLAMATEAHLAFDADLPNFLCKQTMTRWRSRNYGKKWKKRDVIEAEVLMADGRELYRDITIDGAPSKATDLSEIGGAWSTGEYATVVWNVFNSDAQFHAAGHETVRGRETAVYRYEIKQRNSHWTLHLDGNKYRPAYSGKVWIDSETGRTLRMDMMASGLPFDFHVSSAGGVLDYADVEIDGRSYLLPIAAENRVCRSDASVCAKLNIEFRDYQKFSADSSLFSTDSGIEFGDIVPEGGQ